MSRGEIPGQVKSFKTTLTYDATKDFGHDDAGKGRALGMITAAGATKGQLRLANANDPIVGIFLDLDKDGVASVMITGTLIFRQDAADAVTEGDGIVGGGSVSTEHGYIDDATTAAHALISRGQVLEILENSAGGRVLVQFP